MTPASTFPPSYWPNHGPAARAPRRASSGSGSCTTPRSSTWQSLPGRRLSCAQASIGAGAEGSSSAPGAHEHSAGGDSDPCRGLSGAPAAAGPRNTFLQSCGRESRPERRYARGESPSRAGGGRSPTARDVPGGPWRLGNLEFKRSASTACGTSWRWRRRGLLECFNCETPRDDTSQGLNAASSAPPRPLCLWQCGPARWPRSTPSAK